MWGSSQGHRDAYADDDDDGDAGRAIVPAMDTRPRVQIGAQYNTKPDSFMVDSVGASLYESI